MTSDNFFTQAIIDMDMAPRFLLTPELQEAWVSSLEEGEFNPQLVDSDEWKKLISHPQIFIYQTGKLDSVLSSRWNNTLRQAPCKIYCRRKRRIHRYQ